MAGEYPRIGEFHRTRSHPDARQGTRSTAHRIAKDRNRDGDRSRRREQEASGSHIIHFRTSDQRRRYGVRKEAARGNHTGAYRVQGPRRRYGWRCNPIGYQPNYTHIPNEKAWNLREAVFLKSVCAAPGDRRPRHSSKPLRNDWFIAHQTTTQLTRASILLRLSPRRSERAGF